MDNLTVNLKDYNPNWVKQFELEKVKITNAIGDQILGIEHIGSTSIKGLKAKPIIDIMVCVDDLKNVDALVHLLDNIGYEYVPKPEFKDRRFFRKGLWGQGTCHLHLCEYNSSEWIEKLLFRDYLRHNPDIAEHYALVKLELASQYKFDRPTYTKKKEPFIQSVIKKAKLEIGDKN
ncbi:GrpB family protein [Rummeliibacillus pycnus]|uniref:GrpB family protein n=1 Tax=Rummeliibacillus pycnus TaxID=101070 RepID=UPI003D2BA98A